jgi:DNA-directed RNA polymerase subunit RPC12/RpoP
MPDIFFNCESCGKSLVVDDAGIGLEINCPECNALVIVPQKSQLTDEGEGESKPASKNGNGEDYICAVDK